MISRQDGGGGGGGDFILVAVEIKSGSGLGTRLASMFVASFPAADLQSKIMR